MARKYINKGVHTSPETAGRQNLEGKLDGLEKDEMGITKKILEVKKKGKANIYRGQWTPEQLADAIDDFFEFCAEIDIKPTQPLLRVYLGVAKSTVHEWLNNPTKYGEKSNIIKHAYDVMECYLQSNIDKYPTGSIFLLKTSHGHIEQSKLDVTTNGQSLGSNAEDVKDAISKLGLDKK